MKNSIRFRLSVLMLLEYFVWGAWYVTMGTYLLTSLNVDAVQVGAAYANLSIAAIISPVFVGLIADRLKGTGDIAPVWCRYALLH